MFTSSFPAEYQDMLHDSVYSNFEDCEERSILYSLSVQSFELQLDDSSCKPYSINFEISYEGTAVEYANPDDPYPMDLPLFKYSWTDHLDWCYLEDLPSQQEEIRNRILDSLHMSEDWADSVSEQLVQIATHYISTWPNGNVLFLKCELGLVHYHVVDEYIPPQLVPATADSIKSLKRKRVDDQDSDQNCVICFEEVSQGSEAVSMPCSHMFHGDCIEKWLNTSHYCPVCRFKMPIDDDQ